MTNQKGRKVGALSKSPLPPPRTLVIPWPGQLWTPISCYAGGSGPQSTPSVSGCPDTLDEIAPLHLSSSGKLRIPAFRAAFAGQTWTLQLLLWDGFHWGSVELSLLGYSTTTGASATPAHSLWGTCRCAHPIRVGIVLSTLSKAP